MTPKKVHLYIRTSTEDRQTTEQQEEGCRNSYPDGTEFDVYTDQLSGWQGKRPEYELLKKLVQRGSVKELCVYSISRLGRNVQEASQFLTLCNERNVRVKVISENLDFNGPMGFALFTLFAALAQMDSDSKSQRIREKFRHMKEKGTFVGHGRMPHTFAEKVVEKAETVYNLLDGGKTYRQIANILNMSEHTIGKLVKHRGYPLVTAKMFAKMFPDWHKKGKEHYPTLEEVRQRYEEIDWTVKAA